MLLALAGVKQGGGTLHFHLLYHSTCVCMQSRLLDSEVSIIKGGHIMLSIRRGLTVPDEYY